MAVVLPKDWTRRTGFPTSRGKLVRSSSWLLWKSHMVVGGAPFLVPIGWKSHMVVSGATFFVSIGWKRHMVVGGALFLVSIG